MPFIRYDIGDLAEGPISPCDCGRGYPVLKRVGGRVTGVIRTLDGRCVPAMLFPHLFKDCGVDAYQIVQEEDYSVEVSVIARAGRTLEQDSLMRRVMKRYLGNQVRIAYRYVDRIERSPTGKVLPVISRVSEHSLGATNV